MWLTAIIAACLAVWLMPASPAMAQTPAHPLIGKIVDTRTGALTELTDPALVRSLFPCGAITLLGEVHDNPDHHKMRAGLVLAIRLHSRGGDLHGVPEGCLAEGAFVMEHIDQKQEDVAMLFLGCAWWHVECSFANDLLTRMGWDTSGWPPAKIYYPLFQSIINARWYLKAGNPGNAIVRRISKEGLGAVDQDTVRSFKLDEPLDSALSDALLTELEASHCGLMPKTAFGNMAVAQRFKDANMADVALKAVESYGSAIVFAGNGHVRSDRGIPYYLKQRAPDRKVISVAFVEVEDGRVDPATYVPRDPAGKPATDYVAFAAPAQREDPCEGMRARMKK
jgi:uncharacterized iron-regulated protein